MTRKSRKKERKMQKNPYSPLTKQETQKKLSEQQKIEKQITLTRKIAKRILSSKDGVKYKDILRKVKFDLNKHVLETPGFADPMQDAHFLRGCIIKLGVLESLLNDIERDDRGTKR